jgi:hypothetical protein
MEQRTSKEIAEEIRRNEREYEEFVSESKAKLLEMEKELFESQKKTILDLKAQLEEVNAKAKGEVKIPEHVHLEMVIKKFKGKIEPERIKAIWFGM